MHVVVNHLHFRDPVTEATERAFREAVQASVEAGALGAQVVKVDPTHVILVLTFPAADDADRLAREVGGPWMREHIGPLLARGTERSLGEVIASAQAQPPPRR